jgi:AraC-like DNA-binding protein
MDAAMLMLQEGKLKATDIAERLGYSTLYAFSKAFKGYFGSSPKRYKEGAVSLR